MMRATALDCALTALYRERWILQIVPRPALVPGIRPVGETPTPGSRTAVVTWTTTRGTVEQEANVLQQPCNRPATEGTIMALSPPATTTHPRGTR